MTPNEVRSIIETIVHKKVKYFGIYIIIAIIITMAGVSVLEYMRVKGQNLATKSDIDSLTSKVEAIKFNYLKKIENYKSVLNAKQEVEKTFINSKIEIYNLTTTIISMIITRVNNRGDERKLMEEILWNKIPELLIRINSHARLKKDLQKESLELQLNYNRIVDYINRLLKEQNDGKYGIEFKEILQILEKIQNKLLDYN